MKRPSGRTRADARGRTKRRTPRGPSPADSRLAAALALKDVLTKQTQLETALSSTPGFSSLSVSDRAFARLMAATACRRLGQIKNVLKPYIKRPPSGLAESFLYIGAAQLLCIETPPHAAVHETVNAARRHKESAGFGGMINAVLRRISETGQAAFARTTYQDNLPNWIKSSWSEAYGGAAMRDMARQLSEIPPLDLYAPKDAALWAERLEAELIGAHTLRLRQAGQVHLFPGYEEGAWWVQDLASTLPIQLLGDVAGLTALDMCAAPGGKSMQLAAKGAKVTALDSSKDRLVILADNFARTGLTADIFCTDARKWKSDTGFDIVVLDAPCTATGTFRRHPDVLHSKTPQLLNQLVNLQKNLLNAAMSHLKPGGTLVYCTCSLQPQEGEQHMARLLKHNSERLSLITPTISIPEFDKMIDNDGYCRVLPHFLREQGGIDGFFSAQLHYK